VAAEACPGSPAIHLADRAVHPECISIYVFFNFILQVITMKFFSRFALLAGGNRTLRQVGFMFLAMPGLAVMTGCGLGTAAPPSSTVMNAIQGIAHGGPLPIQDGIVTLYATQNNGYGGAALKLASTATDTHGNFAFTPGFTCPSGQFAYITIAKGNTGGNAVNANSLLMAAMGSCDTLYSGTTYNGSFIWVDELTTVAAAYALGNFITIDSSGSAPAVNISAPANNNAATPCISGVGACTTTVAAGLGHAFTNATNLVSTITGQAYTALPSPANTAGVVPAAMINLMGNIMQSCVNTTGTTGTNTATANDSTGCGRLFSLTTPPISGSAVPTNTLQAMINLAKYPHPSTTWNTACTSASGTTKALTCIFNLATPNTFYTPALTGAPTDWAIAIVYPKGTGAITGASCSSTCPGLTFPWDLALDISDNVYVTNNDSSSQASQNVLGFAYNGVVLWSDPTNTTQDKVKKIATDGLGHVITANNTGTAGSTNANAVITIYSASSGAQLASIETATSMPFGITVDPYNNIWYGISAANIQNIYKLSYTGVTAGVPQYSTATFTNPPTATQPLYQISLDSKLNLWAIGFLGTSGNDSIAYLFPNTGSVASPAYAGTLKSATTGGGTSGLGYGIVADSSGKGWEINPDGLFEITPSGTGDSTTLSAGSGVSLGITAPRYAAMDGDDVFWTADSTSGIVGYDTVNTISRGSERSCFVVAGPACGTSTSSALGGTRGMALDSAGDVWAASSSVGALVEVIGAGAPTWPAISLGKFGRPQ
jgi:hypothetical protein